MRRILSPWLLSLTHRRLAAVDPITGVLQMGPFIAFADLQHLFGTLVAVILTQPTSDLQGMEIVS